MKTTHNLRLLCTDALDLCRHKTHTVGYVYVTGIKCNQGFHVIPKI